MRYFLAAVLFLFTFSSKAEEINIGNKAVYEITIPKTTEEKEQGLMFIKELPKNQGMLFDVRGHPYAAMWMKNTYIPLDMLFIDCDFTITDIHKNAIPLSLDKISTAQPFCYVLEINGGQSDNKELSIGDKITFSSPKEQVE